MKNLKSSTLNTVNRVNTISPFMWFSNPDMSSALPAHRTALPNKASKFRKFMLLAVFMPVVCIVGAICWIYLMGIPTGVKTH